VRHRLRSSLPRRADTLPRRADDSALASDKQGGSFPKIILLPPALCDMTATSLMYVGLTWTYPSVYQMMRGAIIIFTGTRAHTHTHTHARADSASQACCPCCF
jgi:hypothetical protein